MTTASQLRFEGYSGVAMRSKRDCLNGALMAIFLVSSKRSNRNTLGRSIRLGSTNAADMCGGKSGWLNTSASDAFTCVFPSAEMSFKTYRLYLGSFFW